MVLTIAPSFSASVTGTTTPEKMTRGTTKYAPAVNKSQTGSGYSYSLTKSTPSGGKRVTAKYVVQTRSTYSEARACSRYSEAYNQGTAVAEVGFINNCGTSASDWWQRITSN